VLDGASEHVVDSRPAVRRGRPFEEDERRPVAHRLARPLEQPLVFPRGKQLLLERVRRELWIEDRIHQWGRSSTPRISAPSRGSAARWSASTDVSDLRSKALDGRAREAAA